MGIDRGVLEDIQRALEEYESDSKEERSGDNGGQEVSENSSNGEGSAPSVAAAEGGVQHRQESMGRFGQLISVSTNLI